MSYRVGQGYDVHALVPGRGLIIGGVRIEFDRGMLGHSDADVLLHAIIDALLGAAGLGDIGRHFPDSDERYRGVPSRELLARTAALVRDAGYEVGNIDATVIAQAPRLGQYIPAMIREIAAVLGTDSNRINVKAKTGERLGFVGRGEGIEAQAVVLLERTAARL